MSDRNIPAVCLIYFLKFASPLFWPPTSASGLPDIHVIVGIDFSTSNEWQGRKTFRGESLHALKGSNPHNPYQRALASLGAVLTPLLHGNPIPAFGFGDSVTKDAAVFPLIESGTPCLDFNDLMCAYTHTAQKVGAHIATVTGQHGVNILCRGVQIGV